MKKPNYQFIAETIVAIFIGIGSIAGIINSVSKATGLIGYWAELVLAGMVYITWSLPQYIRHH